VTDAHAADPVRRGSDESEPLGPRVTDKRRLDPTTGAVRHPRPEAGTGQDEPTPQGVQAPADDPFDIAAVSQTPGVAGDSEAIRAEAADAEAAQAEEIAALFDGAVHPDTTLAADLTRDLQRLQAEYVNYKKRVDRDREMHRDLAVGSVVGSLLPVLDDIHLARQHGDLEGGPFAAIADKLDAILTKIGVERFGKSGDPFDPNVHEALMHIQAELAEGTEGTTVVQVLQPGYRIAQRIIRPARVAVADPPPPTPPI